MPDDPRNQLDISANGLRPGIPTATVAAGSDSTHSLTESNLGRHTRIYPPDARDTVAWYLRGLQPTLEAGTVELQAHTRDGIPRIDTLHTTQEKASLHSRNDPKHAYNPGPTAQRHAVAFEAVPLPIATTPVISRLKLVGARKSLVASMKSKEESFRQAVPPEARPLADHSMQSSTCELHHPPPPPRKGTSSHQASSENLEVVHRAKSKPKAKSPDKRKLSDTGSGERNRKGPRHERAEKPSSVNAQKEDSGVLGEGEGEGTARNDDRRKRQ